jgi:hypothetical protein
MARQKANDKRLPDLSIHPPFPFLAGPRRFRASARDGRHRDWLKAEPSLPCVYGSLCCNPLLRLHIVQTAIMIPGRAVLSPSPFSLNNLP